MVKQKFIWPIPESELGNSFILWFSELAPEVNDWTESNAEILSLMNYEIISDNYKFAEMQREK